MPAHLRTIALERVFTDGCLVGLPSLRRETRSGALLLRDSAVMVAHIPKTLVVLQYPHTTNRGVRSRWNLTRLTLTSGKPCPYFGGVHGHFCNGGLCGLRLHHGDDA